MLSEHSIIKSCKKGELEEFAKLYDAYVEKIYRFIFYKTSHKETAEDLTSDTFVKALENISSFEAKKGTFQAWLFTIARNTVIDYYRSKSNLVNVEDVWGLGQSDNLLRGLAAKEDLRRVREYLSKLSARQREIVFLRVWEDMPYKQIAEIMQETEVNCKMIFSRTIKRMRDDLGPLAVLLLLIISN